MRRQGQLWSASSESDDDEPKRSYFNDNPRRGTAIARAAAAPPPPPPPVATPPRDRRGVHPPPSTANSGGGRALDVGGEGSSGSPRTCSPHSKTSAYSSATTEEEHDASSEGSYEYTYSYSSAGSSAAAGADAEEGGSDTSMTSATAERIATMAAYEAILHREQQLKLMEARLLRQKEAFSREVRSRSSQRGEDEDISMLVRNQMQQTIPAPHVEAPQPPPLALPPPPPHDADREVSLPPSTSPAPDPPTSRRSSSRRFSVPPLPLSVATANTGTSPIHHHDAEVVEVHRHRENPPQPPPAAEMEMNQPTFVLDPLHRHNRSLQPWANVASNWPTRSPPPVPVEEPRVRNSANAWATTFAGAPLSRQDFTALLRGDDVLADPRVAEKKKPSRSLRAPTPSCSSSSSSSSEAKRPSSDSRTPSRHRSLPDIPTTNQRRGTAVAAVASRKHHEPFAEDQEPITSDSRSVGSIKSAESSTLDFPTPPPEIDGAEEYCCGWFDGNCCSCCPGCWDAMTSTLARIFCCCREER